MLGFAIGVCQLPLWVKLPSILWIFVLFLIGLSSLIFSYFLKHPHYFYYPLRFFSAILLGMVWALSYAQIELNKQFPSSLIKKDLLITGEIISIPARTFQKTRFEFNIQQPTFLQMAARLNWYGHTPYLKVGDKWQLHVKLKSPSGFYNTPKIRAVGYVVKNPENQLIDSQWFHAPVDRIRQNLLQRIKKVFPHYYSEFPFLGFITALTIGERQAITEEQWGVLRNTGTNHLMAIAGLHIGFVSGFFYFIFLKGSKIFPSLLLKYPAPNIAAIASLLSAFLYSALAGFLLPTQRAVIMLAVFLFATFLKRHLSAWHTYLCALFLILLIDPSSTFSMSFWLSFVTVALIIYGMSGRLGGMKNYFYWFKIQWVISVGIIPITLYFFQQVSLGGLLANMIAIPWIGFLVLPFCLVGEILLFIFPALGSILLHVAHQLLGIIWIVLFKIAQINLLQWHAKIPNLWILGLSFIGVCLILAPRGFPSRWLGFIFFLPLLFPHH